MSESKTVAASTAGETTLLIVDGQVDFHPGGSLEVPDADKDAKRIADLILSSISDPSEPMIHRIVATMDSHHKLHIAHPSFWVSKDTNQHPDPFTMILSKDIKDGKWVPRKDLNLPTHEKLVYPELIGMEEDGLLDNNGEFDILAYCIKYTEMLENSGKFSLIIWPEHCLIGTPGHCIHETIREAMDEWCDQTGRSVEFVMKGQNLLTEMYSVFRAEVAISPDTSLNKTLLDSIMTSNRILVCGQALTHCVNHTARDLIDYMKGEEHKVEILADCSSSITGFEEDAEKFLQYISSNGGKVSQDCTQVFEN